MAERRTQPFPVAGRRVAFIWQVSSLMGLYGPFVRRLRDAHAIDTVFLCQSARHLKANAAIGFDPADFLDIVEVEPLMQAVPSAQLPSANQLVARSAEIEHRHGLNVMEIIRADRHFGRDWVVGVDYPRSTRARHINQDQAIHIVHRLAERFAELIERYHPIAVFAHAADLPRVTLVRMAVHAGSAHRCLIAGRQGATMYWATDAYYRPHGFDATFERYRRASDTQADKPDSAEIAMASPARAQAAVDAFRKESRLSPLLSRIVRQLYRDALRHLVARRHGIEAPGYRTADTIAAMWRLWRWKRRTLAEAPPADWPPDRPFILFGLQVEPESSLMAEAPMADNQLALIDLIAKTAPAGWLIVVKEHPGATATRPAGFWNQIRRYPNVRIAPTLDDAVALMNRASATATINGTLGLQAAVAGIPAITFHPNYIGRVLPHVFYVESYASCHAAMQSIRDANLPAIATRKQLGEAFLRTLDDCAFTVEDHALILGTANRQQIKGHDLQHIVDTFIASLADAVTDQTAGAAAVGSP